MRDTAAHSVDLAIRLGGDVRPIREPRHRSTIWPAASATYDRMRALYPGWTNNPKHRAEPELPPVKS